MKSYIIRIYKADEFIQWNVLETTQNRWFFLPSEQSWVTPLNTKWQYMGPHVTKQSQMVQHKPLMSQPKAQTPTQN